MKKTLKILFLFITLVLFCKPVHSQEFDAKLSLILYDSFPGYPNSTPYYDYYGGRYRITVPTINQTLRITHSIPSTLSDGAGHTIPFSIASNNSAYKVGGSLDPASGTVFDANNQLIVSLPGHTRITLWLGGTVSPPTNAFPSNNYSGTIVITAVIL